MGSWSGDGWNEPREYEPGPAEEEADGKLGDVVDLISREMGAYVVDWAGRKRGLVEMVDELSGMCQGWVDIVEAMRGDGVWDRLERELGEGSDGE